MFNLIIADDEEIIRKRLIMKIDWDSLGFKIVGEASNGLELFNLVKERKPDAVLTDIRMPLMNGIQFMEKLKEENIDVEIVVLSGYAEFEYARRMLQLGVKAYILKPVDKEELNRTFIEIGEGLLVKKNKNNDRKTGFIMDAVLGNINREAIELGVREFGLEDKSFCLVNFHLDEARVVNYDLRFAKGLIWDTISQYFYCSHISESENSFMYYIEFLEETELINNLNTILTDINTAFLDENPNYSVSIYYSSVTRDLYEIADKRRELKGIKEILPFLGPKSLAGIEKYQINSDNEISYYEVAEELIKALNNKNLEAVRSNINVLFNELIEEKISFEIAINICFHLINHIYRHLRENNKTNERIREIFKMSSYDFNSFEYYVSLKDFINEILDKAFNELNSLQENFLNFYLQKAIKFIEENYFKDISLSDVAAHIGLSSGYLSHIFKDELDMGFVQYLKKTRIKQSIELLKNSDKKIYEICETVGFNNTRYFSDAFKAEMGVTPMDYRSKFRKSDNEDDWVEI